MLPLGLWLIVENPGFIICDDLLQSAIMSSVLGTNV
jgi:hypothetical protein